MVEGSTGQTVTRWFSSKRLIRTDLPKHIWVVWNRRHGKVKSPFDARFSSLQLTYLGLTKHQINDCMQSRALVDLLYRE